MLAIRGLVCIMTLGDVRIEYLKVVLKEVRKLNEKSIKFDTIKHSSI